MKRASAVLLAVWAACILSACAPSMPDWGAAINDAIQRDVIQYPGASPVEAEPTPDEPSPSEEASPPEEIASPAPSMPPIVTFPANLFVEANMSGFDPVAYAEENGFTGAVLNDDGSITATMSEERFEEAKGAAKEGVLTYFELFSLLPSVRSVDYTDDFRDINILADGATYQDDFTPAAVALAVMPYQIYLADGYGTTIYINDAESGTLLRMYIGTMIGGVLEEEPTD